MNCSACGASVSDDAAFCSKCGAATPTTGEVRALAQVLGVQQAVEAVDARVDGLIGVVNGNADLANSHNKRLAALEERLNGSTLFSDSFWGRAFTVYGYVLIAGVVVGGLIAFIVMILGH